MTSRAETMSEKHGLEAALAAIAVWVMKYRYALGKRDETIKCGPEDVARVAQELRVPASELAALASKGPNSAALLEKMLLSLDVKRGSLPQGNSPLMRDLQRLCVACVAKRRCQHELVDGTAAQNFRDFCPNAYTLDALLQGE